MDYEDLTYENDNGFKCPVISNDIARGIYDIEFGNSHYVAQYMFEKLDIKTFEALTFEMEALLRFSPKEKDGI